MKSLSKLFRTILFAGLALFAFTACSNDDGDENDERENILSKEYQLENIKWGAMSEDETTCRTFDDVEEIIANKYDKGYEATIRSLEDYEHSSQFFSDDPELFMHLIDKVTTNISIPSESSFSTKDIFYSIETSAKAPLSLKAYIYPNDDKSYQRVSCEAPFKVQSTAKIEEYQVSATYLATFKEVNGNETVEITGKWKGVYYRCKYHNCVTSDYGEKL